MKVYHGTSVKSLAEFEKLGFVPEGTYWGTLAKAQEYAASYSKDGVILATELEGRCTFKANMTLANQYFEDGELEELPDEDDVRLSLEEYDSVIAGEDVVDFEIVA
jgi:hypothetical protein